MKVVKRTGLAPVMSLKTGKVFGLKPAVAHAMVAAGEAALVPIPEGVETIEVSVGLPKAKEAERPPAGMAIPDGWESLHHLKRIALARELAGDFTPVGEEKVSEAADRIIREEIQRRAAAASPAE